MPPILNSGACYVSGCRAPQNTKGLCNVHYQEYIKSREHHRDVLVWEMNNSLEPMAYSTYVKRVRGIVRGLPVSKSMRNKFTASMYAAYRRGYR